MNVQQGIRMAVYLVTWNLNAERANYAQARESFLKVFEGLDVKADDGLETVRWVSTEASLGQLASALKAKLDDNDRLFITQVDSGLHTGRLKTSTCGLVERAPVANRGHRDARTGRARVARCMARR